MIDIHLRAAFFLRGLCRSLYGSALQSWNLAGPRAAPSTHFGLTRSPFNSMARLETARRTGHAMDCLHAVTRHMARPTTEVTRRAVISLIRAHRPNMAELHALVALEPPARKQRYPSAGPLDAVYLPQQSLSKGI